MFVNYLFSFFIGAVFGSFLLVVANRTYMDRDWKHSRSECESCGKQLVWWELIPIASYLMLAGRCSKCKEKININHFISEITLGASFALLLNAYYRGISDDRALIINLIVISILWLNTITDFLGKFTLSYSVYIAILLISVVNDNIALSSILVILSVKLLKNDNLGVIGAGDIDLFILLLAATNYNIFDFFDMILVMSISGIGYYIIRLRDAEDRRIPLVPFIFGSYLMHAIGII